MTNSKSVILRSPDSYRGDEESQRRRLEIPPEKPALGVKPVQHSRERNGFSDVRQMANPGDGPL